MNEYYYLIVQKDTDCKPCIEFSEYKVHPDWVTLFTWKVTKDNANLEDMLNAIYGEFEGNNWHGINIDPIINTMRYSIGEDKTAEVIFKLITEYGLDIGLKDY